MTLEAMEKKDLINKEGYLVYVSICLQNKLLEGEEEEDSK